MSRSEYAQECRRNRRIVARDLEGAEAAAQWLATHPSPEEHQAELRAAAREADQREADARRRDREAAESAEIRAAMAPVLAAREAREIEDLLRQEEWSQGRAAQREAEEQQRRVYELERLARDEHARRHAEWISHFRASMTARQLLSIASERRHALAVLAEGGKFWLSDFALRETVIEALAILRERQIRRSRRSQPEVLHTSRGEVSMLAGRIACQAETRRRHREAQARARWEGRVAAAKLGLSRARRELRDPEILGRLTGRVASIADGAIRLAVRCVGPIGDQAAEDLARMATRSEFGGKRGRHHKLEETTLERIEALPDWSAALITLCDHKSFGARGLRGGDGYQSVGGNTYRCYLAVRDTTTGEAHLLRVPPKFGNSGTHFFRAFRSARERIQAAVAWTFGLESRQYTPAVEA